MTKNKKSISLVLSSGGARGIAHIGVIEVLEENGYIINSISGSSIGAVVGGVFAAGKLKEYKDWICSLSSRDVLKLMDFTLPSRGIIKGDKVFLIMQQFMEDINIEELPISFVAVGTDLGSKKEIVFRNGSLYEAMRASVSVPGIITPFIIEGREVVDGGVLNPLPIEFLDRKSGNLLVVSNVNSESCKHDKINPFHNKSKAWVEKLLNPTGVSNNGSSERKKMFNIYAESISLMSDKITQMTIEKYKPEIEINISKSTCGTFEFHFAKELIVLGRTKCIESLKSFNGDGVDDTYKRLTV